MKQQFLYAIVDSHDKLALLAGQCPIYWRRFVAEAECASHNGKLSWKEYRVERVAVQEAGR